jgi:hypothetical protein
MRAFAVVVICSLSAAMVVGAAAPRAAKSPRLRVAASADAYVNRTRKNKNFGRSRSLVVARSGVRAFVRFELRSLDAQIVRAKLRVYVRRARGSGFAVRTASPPMWSERGVTYASRPVTGRKIASARRLRRGWLTLDVSRAVRGNYLPSLALTLARGRVSLGSRESGRTGPRLLLTLRGASPQTLVAAGDIASCSSSGDEATAAVVAGIPGTVAVLGDNAYEKGTLAEYNGCYGPSWGRFKARTRPAAGNHEYETPSAAGYYAYFGAAAAPPRGYYSYNLGLWHVVVLNSNCGAVGGCNRGSAEQQWLQADLAGHRRYCTLAYWHHPLFSSGATVGNATDMAPLWQTLRKAGADLVLTGHDHNYERFAPQNERGVLDPARGLREFVVGTGGRSHFPFGVPKPHSEVRNADTYGVLQLTLHAARYDWRFVPVAGRTFTDSGTTLCH